MKTRVYMKAHIFQYEKRTVVRSPFHVCGMLTALGAGIRGNVLDDTIAGQYNVSCLEGRNTRSLPVDKEIFVFRRGSE